MRSRHGFIRGRAQHGLTLAVVAAAACLQHRGQPERGDGRIQGGSGTWTAKPTNWTNAAGTVNLGWGSQNAVFTAAPGTVTHHVAKTFSAVGSVDPFPGGVISTYTWHWGDGTTSTGAAPTHNYAAGGVHTITLAVVDNYGRSGTRVLNIAVH